MTDIAVGPTIYDINKAFYQQQSESFPMTLQEKEFEKIFSWLKTQTLQKTQYYMFLCRDCNDYTIFNFIKNNPEKGIKELKDLINSRGKLKDILYNDEYNYYEFWISIKEEEYMFILFPCNDFVIEIGD